MHYVRECMVCLLPIPLHIWDELRMDFVKGLLKYEGLDTIPVIVDKLTKYALRHPFTGP